MFVTVLVQNEDLANAYGSEEVIEFCVDFIDDHKTTMISISSADGNGVKVYKLQKNSKWGSLPRKVSQKCTNTAICKTDWEVMDLNPIKI